MAADPASHAATGDGQDLCSGLQLDWDLCTGLTPRLRWALKHHHMLLQQGQAWASQCMAAGTSHQDLTRRAGPTHIIGGHFGGLGLSAGGVNHRDVLVAEGTA